MKSAKDNIAATARSLKLSFGMPVRDGEATIGRALDSLLAQTFSNFEIVISDNASNDGTEDICRAYAAREPRVRYYRNPTNLGQIANFNRVLELSQGEYFQWVGCNDWWSPRYAECCVTALDANPKAIMVSCDHEYHWEDGRVVYEEYHGPRVDSGEPHKRFARMLWFFRASRYIFDPIYSMMRREALMRTARLRMMLGTDYALAAELSLLGPIVHVPEKLVFRHITPWAPAEVQLKRFDPRQSSAKWHFIKLCRVLTGTALSHRMSTFQKAHCTAAVAWYFAVRKQRELRMRLRSTLALRRRWRNLTWRLRGAADERDALGGSVGKQPPRTHEPSSFGNP